LLLLLLLPFTGSLHNAAALLLLAWKLNHYDTRNTSRNHHFPDSSAAANAAAAPQSAC